ncbi:hypothetical protein PYW07_003192 [Mythimna separata]|uniref:Peptidase S1 domain-containing protein n=1 Tax=Mythimna separata TaxID=271217 RepID=A0AAD7YIT3_MYTSE|nr:hypothetical protein PYW07_003192 [Mythimna separata]
MFFKYLLCIILFSKQILPLLGAVIPPLVGNNNSFINDPNALSMYAKYEEWNPRVINGWAAKLGDVPYQAALKIIINRSKGLYMTFCGASVLGPRKLLTAAHCFDEKVISNCNKILHPGKASSKLIYRVHVVAGTLKNIAKFKSDGQWRRLQKVQYPKTYHFPKDDIAVAITKKPFIFNSHVSAIPIASKDLDYQGKCLASGYGRTATGENAEVSAVLLMAHLTIIPNDLCRRVHKKSARFVCTSCVFTDVGKGDSGGPLVCSQTTDPNEGEKGLLVGVTSGTMTEEYTLFTRVSTHKDFINSLTFPLLGNGHAPVISNNQSCVNDSDSLSTSESMLMQYDDDWRPRVVNGFPARKGDVPYQVALKTLVKRSKSLYVTFCGAAIIGPKRVLTAAHCFEEKVISHCNLILYPGRVSTKTLSQSYAVAGTLKNVAKYDSDGQWRELEEAYFPKTFEFPKDDIAVVVLFKKLDFNKHVGPIPMASTDIDYAGKCLVSGYGRVGVTKESAHSPVLQLAHLFLIQRKRCNAMSKKKRDKFICTSTWFTDVGMGDSGGPLACARTGDPQEDKSKGLNPMFYKYLLCITLFSNQTQPVLGRVLGPNNNSFVNDPESLSLFAKYEMWNPRVINGWEAKLGDVPYQVALKHMISRRKLLYRTYCGASIVAPRKLISAAHCFEEEFISKCIKKFYRGRVSDSYLSKIAAVAGTLLTDSTYNSDGGQWRKLKRVVYPKEYNFPEDDIAVIVLKKAYIFNDCVAPIPMASTDIEYEGKCLISGYGKTAEDEDAENSPILLLARVAIIPTVICSVLNEEPTDDFVCTSLMFSDAGVGDSGGPLVCSNTSDPNEGPKGLLVGVVSGTAPDEFTLFTRISRYLKFIESVNSVSMPMYKYNKLSCTAITVGLIYKMFLHS